MPRDFRPIASALALWPLSMLAATALSYPLNAAAKKPAAAKPVPAAVAPAPKPKETVLPHADLWFKGTPDQAFAQAKTEKKPVFAFWGAVWCPSCAELKAAVFADESFPGLMAGYIPLYLDGDTPEAQAWAEKLGVSYYPTTLVITPDGKEALRISELVNLQEFKDLMAGVTTGTAPLKERVAAARKGQATPEQWRNLAYTGWDLVDEKELGPAENLQTRLDLFDAMPASLARERAALASALLVSAAQNAEGEAEAAAAKVRARADDLLAAIFRDDATAHAARGLIAYGAEDVVPWLEPDAGKPGFAALRDKWLKAAKTLAADPSVSLDQRLWASQAEAAFFRAAHKDAPLPPALVAQAKKAVAQADKDADNYYQRHAVMVGAAKILRDAGDFAGARALLDKELKSTDTPWYVMGSYANLEKAAGRPAEALAWSEKARHAAEGRASKIQWIVSDAQMIVKLRPHARPGALGDVLKAYYEAAFSLPDGFLGRNALRARTLAKDVAPLAKDKDVAPVVAAYAPRCASLADRARDVCQAHFAKIQSVPPVN